MIRIIGGIALMVIGLGLRWMAMRQLRHNFTLDIRRPVDLVTDGLYRHMRHPSYVGSMLFLFGLGLVSITLAFCYLVFVVFLIRSIDEECRLILGFEGYGKYWEKTPAFFPGLYQLKRKLNGIREARKKTAGTG